jgi:hypothetical protein
MNWKRCVLIGVLVAAVLVAGMLLRGVLPGVWAQEYRFTLDRNISHVVVNRDGSADIEYWMTFTPDPGAHSLDIIDIGLPNKSYDLGSAQAWYVAPDGQEFPVSKILDSEWLPTGVEIHMGEYTIQPGNQGTLHFRINVRDMVYPDTEDESYASLEFVPHYYEAQNVHGRTYLETYLFFPPGVTEEETKYHGQEFDEHDLVDDRIVFIWVYPETSGSTPYRHGISFPRTYVDRVVKAPVVVGGPQSTSGSSDISRTLSNIPNCLCQLTFFVIVGGIMVWMVLRSKSRKMRYLPPALSVEGVGIKRGLTAVEAAILLELPLNKILTMILFGLVKKRALTVLEDDPLRLEPVSPFPEGKLRTYETGFLEAVKKDGTLDEKKLQAALVALVKSVNKKMKGFSRKETIDYYRQIIDRAWEQVSAADTPEIRSKAFDHGLEWIMMDRDFEKRSTETFESGPLVMPPWWAHYRPWVPAVRAARTNAPGPSEGSGRPSGGRPSGGAGRQITLPTLPGAAFASTVVAGMERTSSNVVSRLESFTGGVTQRTHPVSTGSSSSTSRRSGGCACACACACAGCACACAGGGR